MTQRRNETMTRLANYPRPDMARDNFILLDGEWEFDFDERDRGIDDNWQCHAPFTQKIRVPFCVESEASGIGVQNPPGVVWHSKRFSYKPENGRALLHFGAVDYKASAWLNGRFLGWHVGGYAPFCFDVTGIVQEENLLVVRVEDSRSPKQPRGKQTVLKRPVAVFYTGVTGIWQSVWLESAGKIYLESFKVTTDITEGSAVLLCRLMGDSGNGKLICEIQSPDGLQFTRSVEFKKLNALEIPAAFSVKDLKLWSPENPNLYSLKFTVLTEHSADEVKSYFGFRKIEACGNKIYLNDAPLYQKLLLVQGYFPEGHYTPVDDGQYKRDVELVKELGFNGLRMHEKIEHKKFLFWCDALGCLVWEEMPSAQLYCGEMKDAVRKQWSEIMERDMNHPCIIAWVPMNESWGVGVFPVPLIVSNGARAFVKELYRLTKLIDPSRLVVDNSGYDHTDETDIVDVHHYLGDIEKCRAFYNELRHADKMRFSLSKLSLSINPANVPMQTFTRGGKYKGQPILISEYGGFGFYKTKTGKSLLENFSDYTKLIQEQDFICGYCYTQLYDTFQEKNGLLDFNRVPRVDVPKVRKVNCLDTTHALIL